MVIRHLTQSQADSGIPRQNSFCIFLKSTSVTACNKSAEISPAFSGLAAGLEQPGNKYIDGIIKLTRVITTTNLNTRYCREITKATRLGRFFVSRLIIFITVRLEATSILNAIAGIRGRPSRPRPCLYITKRLRREVILIPKSTPVRNTVTGIWSRPNRYSITGINSA